MTQTEQLRQAGDRLATWVDAGALRALDLSFARFVMQESGAQDVAVLLAVVLLSERNGHGHVCLALSDALRYPEQLLSGIDDAAPDGQRIRRELAAWLAPLSLAQWVSRLASCEAVERLLPGDDSTAATPLVLAGSREQPRLYLRRYWRYEALIRRHIDARLDAPIALDEAALGALLAQLFPAANHTAGAPDWQQLACVLAARYPFAIITGGPGTGKTHTVLKLLAMLQGLQLLQRSTPLHISMAAPTGKAAARLNETIADKIDDLPIEGFAGIEAASWRAAIPTEVSTLHRLLGVRPDSRHFRHHGANPLPDDLIVVDEASMVDVEMMASLLAALRPEARLILLGDKDQLASVEAGAVLGDLCRYAAGGHYRPATAAWLQRVAGAALPPALTDEHGAAISQVTTLLRRSYRFSATGGIGGLAALVNEAAAAGGGHSRTARLLQAYGRPGAGSVAETDSAEMIEITGVDDPQFEQLVIAGYRRYLQAMVSGQPGDRATQPELAAWAGEVLATHGSFQLLCALRRGHWGVRGLNERVQDILAGAGLLPDDRQRWYAGRPVLVTRNDYGLRLMNGDIGIALSVPCAGERDAGARSLRVAFASPAHEGGIRWFLPSRLQQVETVFAMTVHKSQGSEFQHAALLLPPVPGPALTSELLYTGITRARQRFSLLYSNEAVIPALLDRRIARASGLGEIARPARGEASPTPATDNR